jgi:hypothetical protein
MRTRVIFTDCRTENNAQGLQDTVLNEGERLRLNTSDFVQWVSGYVNQVYIPTGSQIRVYSDDVCIFMLSWGGPMFIFSPKLGVRFEIVINEGIISMTFEE